MTSSPACMIRLDCFVYLGVCTARTRFVSPSLHVVWNPSLCLTPLTNSRVVVTHNL